MDNTRKCRILAVRCIFGWGRFLLRLILKLIVIWGAGSLAWRYGSAFTSRAAEEVIIIRVILGKLGLWLCAGSSGQATLLLYSHRCRYTDKTVILLG